MSSLERETEQHYNSYPFEFLTKENEQNIEAVQPNPFIYFVKTYLKNSDKVADIGCGGGRGVLYLAHSGLIPYAFDLSIKSLQLTRDRCNRASYTCGTNLSLPFQTESFDAIVSDGVIHHTPDAIQSLKENIRILKKGGYLYLAVYKKEGYYFYIYTYMGKPIRWVAKTKFGRAFVTYTLGFIYFLIHLIRKKGILTTWQGAKYFFYDYIITPMATFYKKQTIESIAHHLGLEELFYDGQVGNVHIFIFRKKHEE